MVGGMTIPVLLASILAAASAVAAPGPATCLRDSGNVGARCLRDYVGAVSGCRVRADAACEASARADGGILDELVARADDTSGAKCTEETAAPLGYTSLDDVGLRVSEACGDFGEDLLAITFADSPAPAFLGCQTAVARGLDRLRIAVVRAFRDCDVRAFTDASCNRAKRDRAVGRART